MVSEKYDIPLGTVKDKASKEMWFEERKKRLKEIESSVLDSQDLSIYEVRNRQTKIIKNITDKLLSKLSETDFNGIDDYRLILAFVNLFKAEKELYPSILNEGIFLPKVGYLSSAEVANEIRQSPHKDEIAKCLDKAIELLSQNE
ncbi:MAG: hypothetical protein UR87_C0024G0007 [candidate division CPR3 bacterium GW2011_GWE2_35_7]|nr:MAG: hypothetical protein UR87_C0024G0007 [candidate division CPR3 bacterium GW2011_GWE2_35_7]